MLIVGWFQNFKTPIVMMLIPLSLIGIVFGHWLWELISQTSFIGMIALAGLWCETRFY
jgi:multidrug efflux pump subunit AcrB